MLIIKNQYQLHHIIDPDILKLVTLRLTQLGSNRRLVLDRTQKSPHTK